MGLFHDHVIFLVSGVFNKKANESTVRCGAPISKQAKTT